MTMYCITYNVYVCNAVINSSWPSATYMRRDSQCLFPQRPRYGALIQCSFPQCPIYGALQTAHSLLSPRWVNTSSSCWRQTRTPPSRTPALLGLGWIPPDLGAFNLGLIAPVTAQTLGYRSAWSPGTALSHLGSASLVAQGLYSDIGLQNVGTNGLSFVLGRLSYRTSIYTCRYT